MIWAAEELVAEVWPASSRFDDEPASSRKSSFAPRVTKKAARRTPGKAHQLAGKALGLSREAHDHPGATRRSGRWSKPSPQAPKGRTTRVAIAADPMPSHAPSTPGAALCRLGAGGGCAGRRRRPQPWPDDHGTCGRTRCLVGLERKRQSSEDDDVQDRDPRQHGQHRPTTKPRSVAIGITTAAEDVASSVRKIAMWSTPDASAISHAAGTATANESADPTTPMPTAVRRC